MARVKGVWVEVSQDDIDRGIPNHKTLCPVARALRRVLSGNVEVDGWCCVWMGKDISIDLPYNALWFIDRFDGEVDKVRPFKFFLPLN